VEVDEVVVMKVDVVMDVVVLEVVVVMDVVVLDVVILLMDDPVRFGMYHRLDVSYPS